MSEQPNIVQPSPVPTSVTVGVTQGTRVNGNGTPEVVNLVVIQLASATGQAVYFFDPDEMEGILSLVQNATVQARSGLHIPPVRLVRPE